MGKEQWQAVFVLVTIFVAGFFLQSGDEDVSGEAVRRSLSQAPVQTQTAPVSCGYLPITQPFLQRLGSLPSLRVHDFNKLINNRYLAITAWSFNNNIIQLYLYDIGADGIFNTADDKGFLVDSTPRDTFTGHLDSITVSGITTLFWYSYSGQGGGVLKQCILTSQGCTPTTLTTISPNIRILGLVSSTSTNRLYFAYTTILSPNLPTTIASCSLQSGLSDSCNNGLNSFFPHQQISPLTNHYSGISDIGFFISDYRTTNPTNYVLNIQQPAILTSLQGNLNLYPTQHNPLIVPFIFAVQNTFSGWTGNGNSQLVMIDSLAGTVIPFETLSTNFIAMPLAIQSIGSSIVTLYQEPSAGPSSPNFLGKRAGSPPVLLSVFPNSGPSLRRAITLPDSTVLGILQTSPTTSSLVQFDCIP